MKATKQKKFYAVLLAPTLIFLGIFLLLPLIQLLILSFQQVDNFFEVIDGYTLGHYVEVLTTPVYLKTIWQTLFVAVITTVICLILAYPAAYLLVRSPKRWRAFFYILLVSPLLTSVVIRTFAWIILLAQNGLVNDVLMKTSIIDEPLDMLWNMNAVIIAYVQVMLPFAVLPIATSMSDIKGNLRSASMILGSNRIATFFRVTLPLTIPGMISGAMIVFSLAAGSYITPLLVGGRMQPLLPLSIYQQIMQVYNLPLAAAMAFTLMVLVFLVIAVLGYILKKWEVRVNG
ncbi:ABC transporter permease [Terribacillus goriensis]|uniref:ABC transporter permease n=1 Tax=Terribacillus saccharophilus TaxID=361277 RepID=UPI0039837A2F